MRVNEFTKCLLCGNGVLHAGQPVFLRVTVEYHVIHIGAVQRAAGLEQAFGLIAAILGPDEDLTQQMTKGSGLVCAGCMVEPTVPFALLEATTAAEVQRG